MADPIIPASNSGSHSTDDLESLQFEIFWEKHRQKILAGIAAFIVLGVGLAIWQISARNIREQAEASYAAASTVEAWQEVATRYPKSIIGGNAQLRVAAALRDGGKLDEALVAYESFISLHPEHPLIVDGHLGLATIYDKKNQPDQAIAALKTLASKYPNSFAAPYALYVESEILLREGKRAEASRVLQELVKQYVGTLPAQLGGAQLDRIATITETQGNLDAKAITP